MSESSICIKVKKIHGEKTIVLASKLGILRRELKIHQSANHIYIPIVRKPEENELLKLKFQLPNFELTSKAFTRKEKQRKTLHQILEKQLPPKLLGALPRALDIIGDIAIIEIPPELKTHESLIGEAVLKTHKNVRTTLAKIGAVSGTYRLRNFKTIAGEHRTSTIHKEHGCQYHIDIAKAYFSPRLSHEHKRVASIIHKGETVVDLFSGVGPFSILIAKRNSDVKVYAVDINSEAVELLKRNIRLNRVATNVIPILGNARQAIENQLLGVANRLIMNLPEKSMEFVDVACKAIKPTGGIVHFYAFVRFPDSIKAAKLRFSQAVEKAGRRVSEFLTARTIRETAPYEFQIVLDARIL